jgi:glucosamine-6-phosphate deaminase
MTNSDILTIGADDLVRASGTPVEVAENDSTISDRFAREMIGQIEHGNRSGRPTNFILPVGPRGGYPVFVEAVREKEIDLSRTSFFFMDEYLDEDGGYIASDRPLSFRGFVKSALTDPLSGQEGFDGLRVYFPDPGDVGRYGRLIREAGGIDLALCGVGLDGHVAFNEPQAGMAAGAYAELSTRVVTLTTETRVVNAVMEAGGAVDLIPRRAVTVGMAEIMAARRIVVFMNRSWQRAVVRRFLFGEATAAFPVSLLRRHAGLSVIITEEVSRRPLP